MREIGILLVDVEKIEKELLFSDILVKNRWEPYYSLSCLKEGDYDMEFFCAPCPRLLDCMKRFLTGGYITNMVIY